MSKPDLGAALSAGQFVVAPGIHDMIAAVLSNEVGFDFVYASGFWLTASAYGLPDAGIATYTQMLDRVSTLARTAKAGVIADADTGYGGLLNVHHTVLGYEAAGVVAIQIEDQEFPKKCGHTPNKRVVPLRTWSKKSRSPARRGAIPKACSSLLGPTPDRPTASRARCAGGSPTARLAPTRLSRSVGERGGDARGLLAHPQADDGEYGGWRQDADPLEGRNWRRSATTGDLPLDHRPASAAAAEKALHILKAQGTSVSPELPLYDFKEFNALIGFEEVWEFERRWARPGKQG